MPFKLAVAIPASFAWLAYGALLGLGESGATKAALKLPGIKEFKERFEKFPGYEGYFSGFARLTGAQPKWVAKVNVDAHDRMFEITMHKPVSLGWPVPKPASAGEAKYFIVEQYDSGDPRYGRQDKHPGVQLRLGSAEAFEALMSKAGSPTSKTALDPANFVSAIAALTQERRT
jgi:hypothetical protein